MRICSNCPVILQQESSKMQKLFVEREKRNKGLSVIVPSLRLNTTIETVATRYRLLKHPINVYVFYTLGIRLCVVRQRTWILKKPRLKSHLPSYIIDWVASLIVYINCALTILAVQILFNKKCRVYPTNWYFIFRIN